MLYLIKTRVLLNVSYNGNTNMISLIEEEKQIRTLKRFEEVFLDIKNNFVKEFEKELGEGCVYSVVLKDVIKL